MLPFLGVGFVVRTVPGALPGLDYTGLSGPDGITCRDVACNVSTVHVS
jgi:hypothetical protein